MKIIDYILIGIIAVLVLTVLVILRRNKGKCAYCSHKENCPFKKL